MIRVAVCGATGYAGRELLRLLSRHDAVEVLRITSESQAGKSYFEVEPGETRYQNLVLQSLKEESVYRDVDFAFLALPHQPAAVAAARYLEAGAKVVDLSAAYRIQDLHTFEQAYRFKHPYPNLIERAVYGLTELRRKEVKQARLVANPGCYPTSVLLPMIPLLRKELFVEDQIIVDAKSGFSGRGRKTDVPGLFVEMNENFYAYGLGEHRHRPEIAQELSLVAGKQVKVTFSPHVLPLDRGMLSTIYFSSPKDRSTEILNIWKKTYREEPFIRVYEGTLPHIKWVSRTNDAAFSVAYDEESQMHIVVSVIDNLLKGAAGQAVQNMNVMMDFPETDGLD